MQRSLEDGLNVNITPAVRKAAPNTIVSEHYIAMKVTRRSLFGRETVEWEIHDAKLAGLPRDTLQVGWVSIVRTSPTEEDCIVTVEALEAARGLSNE